MNISLIFTRTLFFILSIFFMTTYMASVLTGSLALNILIGIGLGAVFGVLLIGFDIWFKRFNLRAFNIAIIGIFIGYLMGQALVLVFDAILDISAASVILHPQVLEIIKLALFLFGVYLGTIMTLRAADELYVSIPFVKLTPSVEKKKDLLVDLSVLSDARIIDLASSGLLDHQMIMPRFMIKELYAQSELGDEGSKAKARRALDVLKKLEALSSLELRYNDTDFPDVKELSAKLIRLARLLDANILSSDLSRIQISTIDGIRIVNIHALANALKPLTQGGEMIKIKIQRYGKEPRQGVGYLEDGTMVVVNGGGSYIGETIEAQVLSVKHTTSGRLIFCNALEGEEHFPNHYEDNEYEDEK
jgi:uncharacterized protein YacL